MQRYFMDHDDGSNWYWIPVENRREWEQWKEHDQFCGDDPPYFANMLSDVVSRVTFTDPQDGE